MKTVTDFYHEAIEAMDKANIYFGHGTEEAASEAWWLIASTLKLPIDGDLPDRALTAAEEQTLQTLLQKRITERIPTAYLLHEAYQNGYRFYVDERVLIPRSPIAELIENRFAPWIPEKRVHRILDLCTGSGCLAILAAHAFPGVVVDASDFSFDALAVAAKNVALHQVGVRLFESDVFAALGPEKYDVILSNPPYVDAQDLREMPAEYHHEPELALAAGHDGLDIAHRILKEAKAHLNPGGILIVEVGNSMEALMAAYPSLPFIWLEFERGGDGVFLLRAEDL